MDGIECLREVTAFRPEARSIIISAMGREELVEKYSVDAVIYITRPPDDWVNLFCAFVNSCSKSAGFFNLSALYFQAVVASVLCRTGRFTGIIPAGLDVHCQIGFIVDCEDNFQRKGWMASHKNLGFGSGT